MPDDLRLTAAEALALAQRLIDEGRPFHAHEVFEAVWKSCPEEERPLWKGLAQIAVGLTHALRGNDRGAVTLLGRGTDAVDAYGGSRGGDSLPEGLDLMVVTVRVRALAERIERSGIKAVPEADFRLSLAQPHIAPP